MESTGWQARRPKTTEAIYATWLALGGATASRPETGVAAIVAAGTTAAIAHDLGDFFPAGYDSSSPAVKAPAFPAYACGSGH